MALTVTIVKGPVVKRDKHSYTVNVVFTLYDNAVEVLTRTVSVKSWAGASLADSEALLQEQIKGYIDDYTAELAISGAAAFDTVVSNLQTTINAYLAP